MNFPINPLSNVSHLPERRCRCGSLAIEGEPTCGEPECKESLRAMVEQSVFFNAMDPRENHKNAIQYAARHAGFEVYADGAGRYAVVPPEATDDINAYMYEVGDEVASWEWYFIDQEKE